MSKYRMNCPLLIDSDKLIDDGNEISQVEFLSMLFKDEIRRKFIMKIPIDTMLFHGSRMFPRIANQIITYNNGKKIRACEIASQLEAGLSEGLLFELNNTNKLSEDKITNILQNKKKKFEMMWLNFNWYANRTIAGGLSCKPCKSMMMLKSTKDIYVLNFVRLVTELGFNKNNIERIDQVSEEKLYIAKNNNGIFIDIWEKISNNELIFTNITKFRKGFSTKKSVNKKNCISLNNKIFKDNGYSGIGIILAQYEKICEILGDNNNKIMGYFDIDFSEGVEMKTENWKKWKNPYKTPTICGCVYDKNSIGVCPELMIMRPLDITKCIEVFYTTRNDYTIYIDEEEDLLSDYPNRLSIDNLTENIVECIGKHNFNLNPNFDTNKPLESFIKNEAPWFVTIKKEWKVGDKTYVRN